MSVDNRDPVTHPETTTFHLLKLILEIGPVLIFFLSFTLLGIQFATKTFMAATIISLALSRWLFGKIAIMPLVAAVFVMIFGGLTIWLNNDLFIKLKLTIVNLFFAVALLGGLLFGKSLLKHIFDEAFQLTDEGWAILTRRWGYFFLFIAALNEVVWRNFSTESWVSFKTFAVIPLTTIFAISQVGLIRRHEPTSPDRTHEDQTEKSI